MSDFQYFGAFLTFATFLTAHALQKRFHLAILNPIFLSTVCCILILSLMGVDYQTYNQSAQVITWFLTPATVCLAIPLYEQLEALKNNWRAILAGVLGGALSALVSIWAMCRLFGLSHTLYVTLLPKSITAAIAKPLGDGYGAIIPLTLIAIMLTGVLGNSLGAEILTLIRVKEPVARGVALGTAAHAIGTTRALELGPVEGAMASLSLVTAGIATVVLMPLFVQLM